MRKKLAILREHCRAVGSDYSHSMLKTKTSRVIVGGRLDVPERPT